MTNIKAAKVLSKNIKQFRRDMTNKNGRRMTQEDLATEIGLIQSAVCRVEQGEQQLSAVELYKAAQTLGVMMEDFFDERIAS